MSDVRSAPEAQREGRPAAGSTHRRVSGSLVFADIVGFTALTERLARNGRQGAEEITHLVSSTVDRLLGVVDDVGGEVVSFGGDALLILVPGAESERRAAVIAAGIRAAVRRANPITTSRGPVRLGVSIGAATGDAHLLRFDGDPSALLVVGPTVTEALRCQSEAQRGEVLLSPRLARRLPPSSLGPAGERGARLLRSPRFASTAVASVTDGSRWSDDGRHRHHPGGGGRPGDHRRAVVAFVEATGTDAIGDEAHRRQVEGALAQFLADVDAAARTAGVTVMATDAAENGVKALLVAGAPSVSVDDDERMLSAVRLVRRSRCGLDVRIGVGRGHVFAGAVGGHGHRTYTVMGDVVNTAARIMGAARAGEVLAHLSVPQQASTVWQVADRPAVIAKGKAEAIPVVAVGEPLGPRPISGDRTSFVGRRTELAQLEGSLAAAARGSGSALAIVGPGGRGKSRLVAEVVEEAAGVRVLLGRAAPTGASIPFGVFRALYEPVVGATLASLEATVARSAPHLRPWLPLLAAPLGVDAEPTPEVSALAEGQRFPRLRTAVVELVGAAATRPTVFVVEDAHHADPSSLSLVAVLAEQAPDHPWLVVVTSREPVALPSSARTIRLRPLSQADAVRLAHHASTRPLMPNEAERIAARAEGHPLFVQELTWADADELPERLEAAIAERIDALAPRDRDHLRQLAAFGTTIDHRLLERAGLDDVDVRRRLGDFLAADEGGVRFRQPLVREVAYQALPYRRRRRLHQRAMDLLGELAPDQHATLAEHAHLAGRHDAAWVHGIAGAREAAARSAHAEAVRLFRIALKAATSRRPTGDDDPDAVARAWFELGDELQWMGQLAEARSAYRTAQRQATEALLRAHLHRRVGSVSEKLGDHRAAIRAFRAGLRVVDTAGIDGHRAMLFAGLGHCYHRQGRLTEARSAADAAVAAAATDAERGHALNLVGSVLGDEGGEGAAEAYEQAVAAFEAAGEHRFVGTTLNNLAIVARRAGRWSEAAALFDRAAEATAAAGNELGSATIAGNRASILSDQGRLTEAEAELRRVVATMRAAGWRDGVLWAQANLCEVLGRMSRFDDADRLLAEIVAEGGPRADAARTWHLSSLVRRGEPTRALAEADRLDAVVADRPDLMADLDLARGLAHLQLGHAEQAEAVLLSALARSQAHGDAFRTALAQVAVSMADPARHADLGRQGRATLRRLGVVRLPWDQHPGSSGS